MDWHTYEEKSRICPLAEPCHMLSNSEASVYKEAVRRALFFSSKALPSPNFLSGHISPVYTFPITPRKNIHSSHLVLMPPEIGSQKRGTNRSFPDPLRSPEDRFGLREKRLNGREEEPRPPLERPQDRPSTSHGCLRGCPVTAVSLPAFLRFFRKARR